MQTKLLSETQGVRHFVVVLQSGDEALECLGKFARGH